MKLQMQVVFSLMYLWRRLKRQWRERKRMIPWTVNLGKVPYWISILPLTCNNLSCATVTQKSLWMWDLSYHLLSIVWDLCCVITIVLWRLKILYFLYDYLSYKGSNDTELADSFSSTGGAIPVAHRKVCPEWFTILVQVIMSFQMIRAFWILDKLSSPEYGVATARMNVCVLS